MTKYYVYRGVRYTKDDQKNIEVQPHALHEKLYRGAVYVTLPVSAHVAVDHIYRGVHYIA